MILEKIDLLWKYWFILQKTISLQMLISKDFSEINFACLTRQQSAKEAL